jgi:hypothetical protein
MICSWTLDFEFQMFLYKNLQEGEICCARCRNFQKHHFSQCNGGTATIVKKGYLYYDMSSESLGLGFVFYLSY